MILDAAVSISQRGEKLTLKAVADSLNITHPLIAHYFKNAEGLRKEVMRYAVKNSIVEIVGRGIIQRDPIALRASKELKTLAKEWMMTQ